MTQAKSRSLPQALTGIWRFKDWRLLPKLLVASLVVVALSLAISGYDSITSSRAALLAQGTLNLKGSSGHTTAAIQSYLLDNRNAVAAASALPDTVAFATNPSHATNKANVLKTLKKIKTEFDLESIEIDSLQGLVLIDTGEQLTNVNVKAQPYFTEAVRGIVGYIANPSISDVTNRPSIFFSAPIFDPAGTILAVIAVRDSLDKLWTIVEKDWEVAGPGTVGILLDEYGFRIAHSSSAVNREQVEKTLFLSAIAPVSDETTKRLNAEKRFGRSAVDKVNVLPLPEVVAALNSPSATFESSADSSSVRHYASLSTLSAKPWRYVVMTPLPVFTKPADDLAAHYLLILVLAGGLTGVGAFLLARAITNPIAHLTQVADRISMGDLDVKIDIDQKDEIGELAESFGRMQTGMQVAIKRLQARK